MALSTAYDAKLSLNNVPAIGVGLQEAEVEPTTASVRRGLTAGISRITSVHIVLAEPFPEVLRYSQRSDSIAKSDQFIRRNQRPFDAKK